MANMQEVAIYKVGSQVAILMAEEDAKTFISGLCQVEGDIHAVLKESDDLDRQTIFSYMRTRNALITYFFPKE